jgi:hypothetical protein
MTLPSTNRSGSRLPGDDAGAGEPTAVSVTARAGSGPPPTGDAGGAIAGWLCMWTLPQRGSPINGVQALCW